MMKQEFEEIAGYEVSTEDYNNIIEPMYMATDMSKQDFVQTINKKRFALPTTRELMRQIKKEAKHLAETCGQYTDYESKERIDKLAKEYAKRKYNLDWANDIKSYVFFLTEYEYPEIGRGCTYPKTLVIGRDGITYERVEIA